MREPRRIGVCDGHRFAARGFSLEPAAACERLSLRAGSDMLDRLGEALGVKLPTEPCTCNRADGLTAMWLGPDEWLVLAPPGAELRQRLASTDAASSSAVDISHRNAAIVATGPRSAEILSAGCPLDLSLSAFPVGACTRTILAKAEIVLQRAGEDRFHIECWRSFAQYVWQFLLDAAKST
jgi:sarcosine oxidase, subunit gamma